MVDTGLKMRGGIDGGFVLLKPGRETSEKLWKPLGYPRRTSFLRVVQAADPLRVRWWVPFYESFPPHLGSRAGRVDGQQA